MGAWLTKHVKTQMALRGISEAEVRAALADPGKRTFSSKSDESAEIIIGKAGERVLAVIINQITEGVITARVAKRKERRKYDNQA